VTGQHNAAQRLMELGFSQYEAQAYVGLLGQPPLTGYALANRTGVPQPKVYEALRRLAAKGAVAAAGGEPARFVAVPPAQLLAGLAGSFQARLADAEQDLAKVGEEPPGGGYRVLRAPTAWSVIEQHAVAVIGAARRHVYVSVNCAGPAAIAAALREADERGVACDVLHFGAPIVTLRHGRTVGHDSTRGVVYRHHQARHLAVVADSSEVVWAVAGDGTHWQSMLGRDQLLAALAKGYIRHDLYIQQIWDEFAGVLEERFGPGMQRLAGGLSGNRPPAGGVTAGDGPGGHSAASG
jgi:sugar-specific transcriptional regulator TrmB